ncbi:MAG: hypothetical protein QMC67_11165 [Candidatus Wallbacteria bacterium]
MKTASYPRTYKLLFKILLGANIFILALLPLLANDCYAWVNLAGTARSYGSFNWDTTPVFNDQKYSASSGWRTNSYSLGSTVSGIQKFWYFRSYGSQNANWYLGSYPGGSNYGTGGTWYIWSGDWLIYWSGKTWYDGVYYQYMRAGGSTTPYKRYYIDSVAPYYNNLSPADNQVYCASGGSTNVSFMFNINDATVGLNLQPDTANNNPSYQYCRLEVTNSSYAHVAGSPYYSVGAGSNTVNWTFNTSGTYKWRVVVYDRLGWNATSPWRTITIDVNRPEPMSDANVTTNLNSPINNTWLSSKTVTFNWDASDDHGGKGVTGYYIKIMNSDGSDYSSAFNGEGMWRPGSGSTSYTFTFAGDGDYKWQVKAMDGCNNKSVAYYGDNLEPGPPAFRGGHFRIDSTPPTISISKPDAPPAWYNKYNSNSVNFKADFSDNRGIKQDRLTVYKPDWSTFAIKTNGVFADPPSGPKNNAINQNYDLLTTFQPEGLWCARYQVWDASRYATSTPVSQDRQFQIDYTPPTIGKLSKVAGISVNAGATSPPYAYDAIVNTKNPLLEWGRSYDNKKTSGATANDGSGVKAYILYVWDSAGTLIKAQTLPAATTSYTLTNLSDGKYYWDIGVCDNAGNTFCATAPSAPEDFYVMYTDTTQANNSDNLDYTKKRNFIVDTTAPTVVAYNPPTPNNNGYVVSKTPGFSGEMSDANGINNYAIRYYNSSDGLITTYNSASNPVITSGLLYKINPAINQGFGTDGIYKFEIQAWDRVYSPGVSNTSISARQTFKIDTMPPKKGTASQPINDDWVTSPPHSSAKNPTFKFSAADDNNGYAGYSGLKQYMLRVWYDPAFPMAKPAVFGSQIYKDYMIGSSTTFNLPDELDNGRYFWDILVWDNAGNWRWYYGTNTGDYTAGSPYGNTAQPTTAGNYPRFRIDTTPPDGNQLVSYIGDVWITVFTPNFVWLSGADSMPGSGKDRYELNVWPESGGTPYVSAYSAPAGESTGMTINITPSYGSGGWPAKLSTGRYYWDVRLIDKAGNWRWYKSGIANAVTDFKKGESFRVDGIPPQIGRIVWPGPNSGDTGKPPANANNWIDQWGTKSVDPDTGIINYNSNKTPKFKFTPSVDPESGIKQYTIILRSSASSTAAPNIYATAVLNAKISPWNETNPDAVLEFTPSWGTTPWPSSLKDGQYYWDVEVLDNANNKSYYCITQAGDRSQAVPTVGANYTRFKLDTVPPIVMTPDPGFSIDEAHPGKGNLIGPKYGYITTISVSLVNFKFSKSIDDMGTSFDGSKLSATGSGIDKYSFVMAFNRDKLKVHENVDIWESGYANDNWSASTTAVVFNYMPVFYNFPSTTDDMLNNFVSTNVYWSVYVKDKAGNESQYVDRKIRIRHIPPNPGHLSAPPHETVTTNRRPKFEWTTSQ